MVRRMTLAGVWLVVLVLATTLTWQIVSAADAQVSDRPIAPLNVAAPVITQVDQTTTTIGGATTTQSPDTSTTSPSLESTTTTQSSGSSTVTAVESTTTTASTWQSKTVETSGGTVILRYRPGEVAYQSATPAPGFQVEVEKQGPPEVKVEFESESEKVEIEASWKDGDIAVVVSTEDHDD